MPDVPFNIEAAVREVVAGTRPGIPRDGRRWTAHGLEQIGSPSRTRLISEDAVSDREAVDAGIENPLAQFGGAAAMPPHLPEGRFIGSMPSIHQDIVLVRITGRMRPLGAWLVAVPPELVGIGRVG